jgi:hypothetical protein
MLGIFENVSGCLINRERARTGCFVGVLSRMNLLGFKSPLFGDFLLLRFDVN